MASTSPPVHDVQCTCPVSVATVKKSIAAAKARCSILAVAGARINSDEFWRGSGSIHGSIPVVARPRPCEVDALKRDVHLKSDHAWRLVVVGETEPGVGPYPRVGRRDGVGIEAGEKLLGAQTQRIAKRIVDDVNGGPLVEYVQDVDAGAESDAMWQTELVLGQEIELRDRWCPSEIATAIWEEVDRPGPR